MLIIISPAKTLDFKSLAPSESFSQPLFLQQAEQLVNICRTFTPDKLASLMKISDKLAALNFARYCQWQRPFTLDNAKQAIFAFKGEVYHGLQAALFNQKDLEFSQRHLRILSGLYGILKPLDLMQPYRLEMGTKLKNPSGDTLYPFWQQTLTKALNTELKQQAEPALINLASDEYYHAIIPAKINGHIIKPIFLDYKQGQYKVISVYAKKARGLMSHYIIKNRIEKSDQLKAFDLEDYQYDPKQSTETQWVFKRRID